VNAVTVESRSAQTPAYGGLIDAIGGIATGVLAILGLTGFDPEGMAGIATIVLGAALMIQAGAILSEYTHILFQSETTSAAHVLSGGDALGAMLMVGASGIVLGVLALLGIASATLISIAVIAYGGTLVMSSGAVRQLYVLRGEVASTAPRWGHEFLAGQMVSGSVGIQLMSGLTAVVLGILAVAGHTSRALTLAALLVLGVTVLLTGTALSSLVLSFMRRPHGLQTVSRRTTS
jgi:hypothetical protein